MKHGGRTDDWLTESLGQTGFTGLPGKVWNGNGGLQGILQERLLTQLRLMGLCSVRPVGRMIFMIADGLERCRWSRTETLTLPLFVLFSVRLQSFPAKNTLTGFSCSLNFHKARSRYRKICHGLKWLSPWNPLYRKWSFMSPAFYFRPAVLSCQNMSHTHSSGGSVEILYCKMSFN